MRKTRFVATSAFSPEGTDSPEQAESAGGLPERPLVADVSMGGDALVRFIRSAGFSGGQSAVSGRAAPKVFFLQEPIRTTGAKTTALPRADDAERGLTAAQTAAGQVSKLQNDYRCLTPSVAADGGSLDTATSQPTLRNLILCFAPLWAPGGPGAVVPARQ
ncbi:hypothetical protein ACIQVK_19460 [Streptomyces sp. NPDC090493]|uniref:hypothetical protein n=1 Tax=Streptomyces sp. NPDC090493 TaxID=3365964 RepID=UPI00382BE0B7